MKVLLFLHLFFLLTSCASLPEKYPDQKVRSVIEGLGKQKGRDYSKIVGTRYVDEIQSVAHYGHSLSVNLVTGHFALTDIENQLFIRGKLIDTLLQGMIITNYSETTIKEQENMDSRKEFQTFRPPF